MKYIRTKDGVYEINRYYESRDYYWVKQDCEQPIDSDEILEQADTIEELCDEFVAYHKTLKLTYCIRPTPFKKQDENFNIYGAIWTNKGLIYVAKMNEQGELELL